MFSPEPFGNLANGKLSLGKKEMFKSLTAEQLVDSPQVATDSVDFSMSRAADTDNPQKGDSGFNSPRKESEGEEVEEILAQRRQMPDDGLIQSNDDEDDDDDDGPAPAAIGGQPQQPLVVEDDDDDEEDDFARVVDDKEKQQLLQDSLRKREKAGMDPCEQVVVKETHPEESGCLVPPVSQLPSWQEAVKELIPEVETLTNMPDILQVGTESVAPTTTADTHPEDLLLPPVRGAPPPAAPRTAAVRRSALIPESTLPRRRWACALYPLVTPTSPRRWGKGDIVAKKVVRDKPLSVCSCQLRLQW